VDTLNRHRSVAVSKPAGLDRRPPGVTDATVAAVGKLSEGLEWIERARGRLYDFHHLCGHADFVFEEAADALAEAGHPDAAALLRREIIGRNVLEGRWTFQVVEEFDDLYWTPLRASETVVRDALLGGNQHVYEAELKRTRTTEGHPAHRLTPPEVAGT